MSYGNNKQNTICIWLYKKSKIVEVEFYLFCTWTYNLSVESTDIGGKMSILHIST